MKLIADLHIHSSYSRACSKDLNLENLEKYAHIKGVGLLGTGDFTHPKWIQEIKSKLREDENGILHSSTGFPFIWQTELSLAYTQGGKGRRIHYIILAPSGEVVGQITEFLLKKGRVDYDGRPIFGMSSVELLDELMKISGEIELIPAHAWTSWFGIFGSESGFDSIKECFGDKAGKIHAIETGMSCYDPKTEVLTDNGWKKIAEVKYSDDICTLNIKMGKIEFQSPLKLFRYKYKGKMYRLKTKRIDLLVTPNHKLLYSPCDFRKKPAFQLKEAELLFNKSKRFKKNGTWIGKNPKYFIIPAVKIRHGSRFYSGVRNKAKKTLTIEPWLKFFGFWVAEGWTSEGKYGDYGVYLANSNTKLILEMKALLENFGYSVYLYRNREIDTIRIRDFQLFSYLKQFGKAAKKFIPPEVKSLSRRLLEIFFEYYIKGDGHRYGRTGKGLSASTISKSLRDDLQEIALKMGISAYYKLHNKAGTPIISLPKAKSKGYKQSADSWNIYFIRNNIHTVLPSTNKKYGHTEAWINYGGFVYCLEVPNHVIYIRRNGVPVWCGNSDPAMNWRIPWLDEITLMSNSDCHSYWPWRIGREANVLEMKELSYKNILAAIKEQKGFTSTIECFPAYGKYHFDGHRLCNVVMSPQESEQHKSICPKCGRKMTIGVLNRVEQLAAADRPEGYTRKDAVPFKSLIPLSEIIAELNGFPVASRKTWQIYNALIERFGNEFNVLLDAEENKIAAVTDEKLAAAIMKNREGKIKVEPGYDGVYGKPVLNGKSDSGSGRKTEATATVRKQKGLNEYF